MTGISDPRVDPPSAGTRSGASEFTPFRRQLKQRKVLPMWSWTHFQIVMVDDDGSCLNQHILVEGPWHRYQDKKGNLYAIRCPLKLTYNEQSRVIEDIPPGSWEHKTAAQREERLLAEKRRKQQEKQESRDRYAGNR